MKNKLIAFTLLGLLGLAGGRLAPSAQAAAPTVTTLAATGVTATNATLNGSVNPNNAATTEYFQYGLTTNYGYLGAFAVLPTASTTQTLPGFEVSGLPGVAGSNWTQIASGSWQSIASSADGMRLAAVQNNGGIWTNGAGTWAQAGPTASWVAIASSADGTRLTAVGSGLLGFILTSTDSGATWIHSNEPYTNWDSVASSADGSRLVAGVGGGGIYTSTDGGNTWTETSAPQDIWFVTSSASGRQLAAAGTRAGGGIWTSTDGGVTWTQTTAPVGGSPNFYNWISLASSADGTRLAAAQYNGGSIWTSTNSGGTWTQTSAPGNDWTSIACSADGIRLTAVTTGGIYVSTDGGATWTQTSAPSTSWQSIASSADGSRAAAAGSSGIWNSAGTATSNLLGGTTYHYRLVGMNSAGNSQGSDLTFTTLVGMPTVTTLAATSVTVTGATLTGTVNPNGGATSAYFQYGLTTSYGSFSTTNALAATNVNLSVSTPINGLTPGTMYHFRLVGSSSVRTGAGADATFTSGAAAPIVTTLAATGIATTNATLNGTVNPNGADTITYFEYGLTTNYGYVGTVAEWPATNATYTLPGLLLNALPGAAGANWTQSNTNTSLACLATSADGTHLAAAASPGGVYTSTNCGATWALTSAPNSYWTAISSSADGTRLAGSTGNAIYTSTNGGLTWAQAGAPNYWAAIVSSADGMRLAAAASSGEIYVSSDGGGTWTQANAPAREWEMASSAGGTRLAAIAENLGNGIWISSDGGMTWTQTSAPVDSSPNYYNWTCIASSADGMQLVAGQYNSGGIWISTDGGGTWSQTTAPAANWTRIASSADGTRLAATANDGNGIWTSTNSGATWTQGTLSSWSADVSSADGSRLAAIGGASGGVWTSTATTGASLLPGTTYHFRLVGSSSVGNSQGNDLTFTTLPLAPTVTTLVASGVTSVSATLNGTVNPNAGATSAYFQYGLTTSYGSFSATTNLAATNTVQMVASLISNLTPGTTYHCQLLGINSAGVSFGDDQTFTTAQPQGLVTEGDAISARTYNSDGDPTNAQFVVDFPITAPGSLESILTWGQNSGTGIPGVGQAFYAYVLRPVGTNFQVMLETGPLTVTSVGTNSFAAPPFNVQTGDLIAHYGRGIPLSIGTGPSSIYSNSGQPIPMPSVGQVLTLPSATYPLYNDGGRNYAIAVMVNNVPLLAITPSGNHFILSWPAISDNTLLQTTNLAAGIWTTNSVFTTTTGTNSVTVPSSAGSIFYRLRSP